MAFSAVTPTLVRESVGSLTLHIATFSSVDSGVWASGLPNAVGYWVSTDSSGGASVTAVAATAGTSGYTFILNTGDIGAAAALKLYVLSRT